MISTDLESWCNFPLQNRDRMEMEAPPHRHHSRGVVRGVYWCMTFVDLFEFCNRKASKRRSINSRTNHSIFRWFLPFHWLFLDLLCFVWYISFRFVILHFVSFSFLSLVVPYYGILFCSQMQVHLHFGQLSSRGYNQYTLSHLENWPHHKMHISYVSGHFLQAT